MQRLSPRFRSQQFSLSKICGETFSPNYRDWYGDTGADLGKILTVLLTTERRRRKNLGGSGSMPPREIFSILIAYSALSWLLESIGQYICKLYSSWMEPCKPTNYFITQWSQCPCCNECAARQVLSILSVTSYFINMFLVASKPTHSFRTRMWWLAGWKKFWSTL